MRTMRNPFSNCAGCSRVLGGCRFLPDCRQRTEMAANLAHHTQLQALVGAVDEVAIACERKWGMGRLELLADADLRDRFRRQQDKFSAAIVNQDLAAVEKHAAAMRRGWQMIDWAADGATRNAFGRDGDAQREPTARRRY